MERSLKADSSIAERVASHAGPADRLGLFGRVGKAFVMATEVTIGSLGSQVVQEVAAPPRMASIRLHDPELTRKLDRLFDDHFARPRQPTVRVQVNHLLKRGLDLLVAGLGLLVLWPVLALSALATLCDTGAPVFYSQTRRIRFGRRARIYKMRTMFVGADRNLDALVDIKNNGRFLNVAKAQSSYTRVGRILERLWIVEMPQLWNVLKGEMSLVGNRPIPDYVIGVLGPTHEVAERFAGPQGMTGYTQIIGREHVTDEERIQLEYHYSQIFEKGDVFIEDLRIILLTALTYLGMTRRRTASDFLPVEARRSGALSAADEVSAADALQAGELADEIDVTGRHAVLACPTCYEISAACDTGKCQEQCVKSCPHDAISIVAGRATINDRCTACSQCVHACPVDAIDKFALRTVDEGLHCDHCETTYTLRNGVYDLLPQRENLEKSPYFEFYESEYVADNPTVHLEDTEWKVRELRPLLKSDLQYSRMLDLGCGAGVLGRRIAADLGIPQTVSADWSTQILEVARREAPEATYVRMDAAYLPFRNRRFDLALLIDVIEHQHKPDQVLSELRRVADRLLLRTPLEECWYETMRRRRKDLFRESSGHVVHYDPPRARRQLSDNGWRVRDESVRHIAWIHWKRVLAGDYPWPAKLTAAGRFGLRLLLPISLYRRLFVTNYNAFCERAARDVHVGGRNGSAKKESPVDHDALKRRATRLSAVQATHENTATRAEALSPQSKG